MRDGLGPEGKSQFGVYSARNTMPSRFLDGQLNKYWEVCFLKNQSIKNMKKRVRHKIK